MATQQFATNLNCGKCVAAIAPAMDAHPDIDSWHVDTVAKEKTLTVNGDVADSTIRTIVAGAGFEVMADDTGTTWLVTYRPLLLVVGYLLGVVLLAEVALGNFVVTRAMRHFMAGFFIVFSFFKLLDLHGFANSFRGYDPIAARSAAYAFAYPFIELILGISYLLNFQPIATNLLTLTVMLFGIVGVTKVLLDKRTIQCACLGTVFNLPMSYVTFIENGLMIVMACAMLAMYVVR